MMIIMSVHHHHHHHHHHHGAYHHQLLRHRPHLNFYIRFKCRRRCADMIIMMTAGDAEDAS